jgi:hypothetical protein
MAGVRSRSTNGQNVRRLKGELDTRPATNRFFVPANDIPRNASFLRDGIAAGIIATNAAVEWADALIAAYDELPGAVYDLCVAPRRQTTAVLDALRQLADTTELTETTARALLDILRSQLITGSMRVSDAVIAAYHLTRPLGPGSALWTEALVLEEDYSLANDGISGSLDQMDADARSWFDQFRGSMAGFSAYSI